MSFQDKMANANEVFSSFSNSCYMVRFMLQRVVYKSYFFSANTVYCLAVDRLLRLVVSKRSVMVFCFSSCRKDCSPWIDIGKPQIHSTNVYKFHLFMLNQFNPMFSRSRSFWLGCRFHGSFNFHSRSIRWNKSHFLNGLRQLEPVWKQTTDLGKMKWWSLSVYCTSLGNRSII